MLRFCRNKIVIALLAGSHLTIYRQLHFAIYNHAPLKIIMAMLRHPRRTIHLKEDQLMLFALQYPSFNAFEGDIRLWETCNNLRKTLTASAFQTTQILHLRKQENMTEVLVLCGP